MRLRPLLAVADTMLSTSATPTYSDGAGYQAGALGTTSYDTGYGLVDVVAAAAALG